MNPIDLINTTSPCRFDLSSEILSKFSAPQLPYKFLWEFITDGRTPARAMTDEAISKLMPALEGQGSIVELGAGGDYYKKFVNNGEQYFTSNLLPGSDLQLDMTALNLPDNSVDALVSVFALEHLFEFQLALQEQYRVLKPKGRLLLVVPFMYYYHAAPDDYYRFSASSLDKLLAPYNVLVRQPLGGRWLLFAEMLHEKIVMGSKRNYMTRLALRLAALPFLACALKKHDAGYALGFACLCEKKGDL